MATKDWKKLAGKMKYKRVLTADRVDKDSRYINVQEGRDRTNKTFFSLDISDSNNNTKIFIPFKTKTKALAFAKAYMRSN